MEMTISEKMLSITKEAVIREATKMAVCPSATDGMEVGKGKAEGKTACPSFPLDVFPTDVQDIILAYNHHEGFSIDYLAASMLTVFAAAMGTHWLARATTSFVTAPIIYMVLVGPPSCGKTPPLDIALKPLRKHDIHLDAEFNKAMAEYRKAKEMKKDEREGQSADDMPIRPIHHQKLVMNTTIESLILTLDGNRRGVLLCSDELDSLIGNFGRYSKGNDEPYWLQLFNGVQLKYERKSTGEYANIPRPYVSIIGGAQPGLLASLFGGRRLLNGFACRMLKVYPEIDGMLRWSKQRMPERFGKRWEEIVEKVLRLPDTMDAEGSLVVTPLDFTNDAVESLARWTEENNRCWRDAEDEYLQGLCGKLTTYLVRCSLVLEVMHCICEDREPKEIGRQSVEGAVRLVEYFRAMDLRVFNALMRQPIDQGQEKLLGLLPSDFTTAEALEVGKTAGVSERTMKRFLRSGLTIGFLTKQGRGMYAKSGNGQP